MKPLKTCQKRGHQCIEEGVKRKYLV